MLDAFDVLMPAFKDRVRGRLRPVLGARCGALLLGGGITGASSPDALIEELELYLQAAGITCLWVPGKAHATVARRARELLASVTQLRSIGIERVILIVSADARLPDPAEVSAETFT